MTAEATVWAWDCREHKCCFSDDCVRSGLSSASWQSLTIFKWTSPLPTSSLTFFDICHFVDILFT
jgi:hypothetical protein